MLPSVLERTDLQFYHTACICGGLEILFLERLLIAFIRSIFKGVAAVNGQASEIRSHFHLSTWGGKMTLYESLAYRMIANCQHFGT